MSKLLFLQSDMADPYALYRQRLAMGPIHKDSDSGSHVVYAYHACRQLLMRPSILIPPSSSDGLDDYAKNIRAGLVRLQNPPIHTPSSQLKLTPDWSALLQQLPITHEFDWVQIINTLPAAGILSTLNLDSPSQNEILNHLPNLLKIMQPSFTSEDAALVNHATKTIGDKLTKKLPPAAVATICGLMIQSYDAGKGILCNALLHACSNHKPTDWPLFVTEVLRYDSPVHLTRRIADDDIIVDGYEIKKGEPIVLLLASANRDGSHFHKAQTFDVHRPNNDELLSLGAGPHACIAKDFIIGMTAAAMEWLFKTHRHISPIGHNLAYEPLYNVRVPRKLWVHVKG